MKRLTNSQKINIILFVLTTLTLLTSLIQAQPSSFFARREFIVGRDPEGVAVGDLNGDGKLDIAAANEDSDNVSVLLGNGDGTFRAAINTPAGNAPRFVASAEINRDGKRDLIVLFSSNVVQLLFGNGDGTFSTGPNITLSSRPYSVIAGDFNNDGRADLATTNYSASSVKILRGNGDGSFQGEQSVTVGANPTSVVVADFNNDGRSDLAVSNYGPNTVSVLRGNGDGTFQSVSTPAVGTNPQSIAAGDFNGDGRIDLVTSNSTARNFSVLLGNGNGNFQTAFPLATGQNNYGAAVGDFNGDGRLDLAGFTSSKSIPLFLGNGNGTFQSIITYRSGSDLVSLATGDFNGDTRADLTTANDQTTTVSVYLGTNAGSGAVPGGLQVARDLNVNAGRVAVADFNRDGLQDLAFCNSITVSTALGNGNGTFQTPRTVGTGSGIESMTVGDFNSDGRKDLAFINGNEASANLRNTVSIMLGNGDGTFQNPNNYPAGTDPESIVVADFNNDGRQDVAAGNENSSNVSILIGNGNGAFAAGTPAPVNGGVRSIAVGDFNQDLNRDLVTSNSNGSMSVLIGNGNGTFQTASRITLSGNLNSIAVNDFNGDGKQDLATIINGRTAGAVFLGNGAGGFQPAGGFEMGITADVLTVGDFNGDGRADLAASNDNGVNISIMTGNGDATFQPAALFGVDGQPFMLAVGEFNNDGKADLATPNNNGSTSADNISILLNLAAAGGEQEPNQTSAQANPLAAPGAKMGATASGDSFTATYRYSSGAQTPVPDLFAVTLTQSSRLELNLLIANSAADLELFLFRESSGQLIGIGASDKAGSTEQIIIDALAPGRYLVGVGVFDGISTYTLSAKTNGGPPPVLPPVITSLSPNSVNAGDPAFTLTVNGNNFVGGSVVRWNGAGRTTTFVSATQLLAAISAADIANQGGASITVVNPDGQISNSASLTINIGNIPSPIITGLSPNSANAGGPGFTLSVTGSNFVNGAMVRWNGSLRSTSFNSPNQLSAGIPANDIANQGTAQITVVNPDGAVSNPSNFIVNGPPPTGRELRVIDTNGSPGSPATVPLQLKAEGDESAISFSLTFDPAFLSNPRVMLESDAKDATDPNVRATLIFNNSQASQGRLGVGISLPPGNYKFARGTLRIASVTFTVAANPPGNSTTIGFGDQPIRRGVSDVNANSLTADFVPGTLTLGGGYEADVTPRPSGKKDGTLTINDWVMIGRFLAGLEAPNPGSEFQRADVAPRGSLGDGALDLNDWVQAGRYLAGSDPIAGAGGPTGQSVVNAALTVALEESSVARAIQIVAKDALMRGQNGSVAVEIDAEGNEAAIGFTINFDPAQMSFVSAVPGSGAQGATLILNQSQLANGRLGVLLAMPPGQVFASGKRQLVVVTFAVLATGSGNSAQVGFGDQPIRRSIADAGANSLTANWNGNSFAVGRAVTSVSAASFSGGDLAVESIVAAFGTNLATSVQAATTLPLPTTLAGTVVKVKDSLGAEREAPLFFVAPTQVNYLIPVGTATGLATLTVTGGDGSVSVGTCRIVAAAPAFFSANSSGQGVAAAVLLRIKPDGSQTFELVAQFDQQQNKYVPLPINLGPENEQVFLIMFGSGFRNRSSLSNVIAKIGGVEMQTLFAGPQGGFAGLDQINLRLSRNLIGRGLVDVSVTVDGQAANTVQLQF